MKKSFSILLALVMLWSCTVLISHAAQTYPVTLSASAPTSVSIGETVDVTVTVNSGTTAGLYTLNFALKYDVTRLTHVSVTCDSAPTGWTFFSNYKNGAVYIVSEAPFGSKGYYNPASGAEALTYTFRFTATSITGETDLASAGDIVATEATSAFGILYGSPFSVSTTVQASTHLSVSDPLALHDGILTGVSTKTTPANLAALCQNSESIAFTDANGNPVASDSTGYVGTGWTVSLTDGSGTVLDSATVVVSGDLNGNGIHDSNDCALVRNAFLGTATLSDTAVLAADINGNGTIESNDYILIRKSILAG